MNPWLYIAKKRKEEKVKKMAVGLIEHCKQQGDCRTCVFYDKELKYGWGVYGCCMVNGAPQCWEIEE